MNEVNTIKVFERDSSFVERLVRSKFFWLCFLFLSFSYPIYRSYYRELPETAPRISKLPNFVFTNGFNQKFGSDNLKGRFYIASFAFTSCPSVCPVLMEKVQKIQKRVRGLGQKVALVTFSVDPENDTPKVLHKYARSLQANPYIWSFLTSDLKSVKELLINGFKVPMEKMENSSVFDIAHSEKLVLVDDEGYIRNYYSTDKVSIDKLMVDLGLLVNRM